MRNINSGKSALAVGSVIGLYHLAWIGLVATGFAKPLMDFVLRLHFIRFNYEMMPLNLIDAAGLVAVTSTIGAAFGLMFALIWNWLSTKPSADKVKDFGPA